jgi:heme-degrading monooxygenase HmoA
VEERKPEFVKLPGLLQKYYIKDPVSSEYGGVYIWESNEAMQQYQQSELAKSIGGAYEVNAQPHIEILKVYFPLRV